MTQSTQCKTSARKRRKDEQRRAELIDLTDTLQERYKPSAGEVSALAAQEAKEVELKNLILVQKRKAEVELQQVVALIL
jgi:hypothetical protein